MYEYRLSSDTTTSTTPMTIIMVSVVAPGYAINTTPTIIMTMPTTSAVFLLRFPASRLVTIARTPRAIRNSATRMISMLVILPVAITSRRPTTAITMPIRRSEFELDLTPRLMEDDPYKQTKIETA